MKNPEMIQVDKLKTFENHPYKVEENEEMEMLTQSIKENGILSPLIVRPIENSEYEIISGHRRLFASKRAGLTEVPAFVYEMDRDKATIALVDSNLHREHLLPSEKAFAYKMKVEAMNRQGERTDLTSSQVGKRLNTYEVIAEESGESRNQIHILKVPWLVMFPIIFRCAAGIGRAFCHLLHGFKRKSVFAGFTMQILTFGIKHKRSSAARTLVVLNGIHRFSSFM